MTSGPQNTGSERPNGGRSASEPERLTDRAYWESVWASTTLPVVKDSRAFHEMHRIFARNLPTGRKRLFEVGCAPGGWLAYFSREHGYEVSGIDYAEEAWRKTITNLEMQAIPSKILCGDFFSLPPERFDVIFSNGFVEHFSDPEPVIARMVDFCHPEDGFVVTIVPAMQGLNWAISNWFRPDVAAGHHPLVKDVLVRLHERCGLETLAARYIGCGSVNPPLQKNALAREFPRLSGLVNLPFRAWNRSLSTLTRTTGWYPELPAWSGGIIYVGRRAKQ